MAECARTHRRSVAMADNPRHRRMLVGEPVRRIEAVVHLRLRVGLGAAGHRLWLAIVSPGRKDLVGFGICPIRTLGGEGQSGNQSKHQDADKILHESPPLVHPPFQRGARLKDTEKLAWRIWGRSPVSEKAEVSSSLRPHPWFSPSPVFVASSRHISELLL